MRRKSVIFWQCCLWKANGRSRPLLCYLLLLLLPFLVSFVYFRNFCFVDYHFVRRKSTFWHLKRGNKFSRRGQKIVDSKCHLKSHNHQSEPTGSNSMIITTYWHLSHGKTGPSHRVPTNWDSYLHLQCFLYSSLSTITISNRIVSNQHTF